MPSSKPPAQPDLESSETDNDETSFHTPEEVAASDKTDKTEARPEPTVSKSWKWWQWRPNKRETVIIVVAFFLIVGLIAFFLARSNPKPINSQARTTTENGTQIVSPLTGLHVTEAQSKRPVTAVMIENSDFARPQSGLREAGVVFEAIAEAGITRFMALYQEAQPNNIGPIRSVRPYYLEWDKGFDASIAHVGGSPEALGAINLWKVRNLDEFRYGAYYHRITSREAPHNVYTSMSKLNAIEKLNGWMHSSFTGFPRKKDAPVKSGIVSTIHFNISSPDYYVMYKYYAKGNDYLRWEGGAKHVDATTGKQLSPKVVIGIVVPYSLEKDGYHSDYQVLGSGKAYVFQDGTITVGKWTKKSLGHQIVFTDANGNPIKLDAGQTWITALSNANEVQYSKPTTQTTQSKT